MGQKIKKAALGCLRNCLKVARPNFLHRLLPPAIQLERVVHVPIRRDVVHRPDQVVKIRLVGQLPHPALPPGDKITLQPKPNRELGLGLACLLHHLQILGKVGQIHSPVVKLLRHWIVFTKTDLS